MKCCNHFINIIGVPASVIWKREYLIFLFLGAVSDTKTAQDPFGSLRRSS